MDEQLWLQKSAEILTEIKEWQQAHQRVMAEIVPPSLADGKTSLALRTATRFPYRLQARANFAGFGML